MGVRDVQAQHRKLSSRGAARRSHWNAVRRILKDLKDLKHTRLKGITYKKGEGPNLKVYADCPFARREEYNRRSVSGVVVMCAEAAVSWFSRTQRCVTLSTVVLGDGIKGELFIRGLISLWFQACGRVRS